MLDGFQRGWRKVYVELLDAGAGPILAAILQAGGQAPLTAIEDLAWEQVASSYGYELDDAAERQHALRLVEAMMTRFADLGAVTCHGGEVVLTGLGDRPGERCCRHVKRRRGHRVGLVRAARTHVRYGTLTERHRDGLQAPAHGVDSRVPDRLRLRARYEPRPT